MRDETIIMLILFILSKAAELLLMHLLDTQETKLLYSYINPTFAIRAKKWLF